MSYAVYAGNRVLNYTYNMARFFEDFGVRPTNWAGRDRKEIGREIGEAIRKIARMKKSDGGWLALKTIYDAPNGWGDVEGAVRFLIRVWAACFDEIPDTVEVW